MQEDPETRSSIEPKLRYEKPVLVTYGRVRDLTAGGTGIQTESVVGQDPVMCSSNMQEQSCLP